MAASSRSRMPRSAIAKTRGVREHRVGLHPASFAALPLEPAEETASPPAMAGDARDRFDAKEHRVRVAIDADCDRALDVSRGLALFPERLARARPRHGFARFDRPRQGRAIHPRE